MNMSSSNTTCINTQKIKKSKQLLTLSLLIAATIQFSAEAFQPFSTSSSSCSSSSSSSRILTSSWKNNAQVRIQVQVPNYHRRRTIITTTINNNNNNNNNNAETTNNASSEREGMKPPNNNGRRKKKKKKIVINTNLLGVENVSSDGILTEQKEKEKEKQKSRDTAVKSNLGKPSKNKKKKNMMMMINNAGGTTCTSPKKKQLSKKAQKLADQRTAMGLIDGTLQAGLARPEDQQIQIQEVKRGNKQVTIVRGFTCAMDERKNILKDLKKKIGGGGALIEGIIELQGSHSDVVIKNLKSKGFIQITKQ